MFVVLYTPSMADYTTMITKFSAKEENTMKTKQNKAVTASAATVSLADLMEEIAHVDGHEMEAEIVKVFGATIRRLLESDGDSWFVVGNHEKTGVRNGWTSSESLIEKRYESDFPRYYLLRLSLREIPA